MFAVVGSTGPGASGLQHNLRTRCQAGKGHCEQLNEQVVDSIPMTCAERRQACGRLMSKHVLLGRRCRWTACAGMYCLC